MVPFLTSPLALIALIGVPALIAIYIFQRRFRTLEVSSLLLWESIKQPSMGGRKRERLRLPATFWLEALAVALLALAAAGPFLARWSRARPLAIVCDDSLSMRGGAHDRAMAFVDAELRRRKYAPVRIIFAGQSPQLGELSQWTCSAPSADLDAAITMASQTAGPTGLVLVLTDHAPERALDTGRIRWESFGQRAPNVGFTAATRQGDRALVEVANYSDTPQPATLQGQTVTIPARARHRLQMRVPRGPYELSLGNDAADFDNRITLLPDEKRPLRVALRVSDASLRGVLEPALLATNRAAIGAVDPELVITDGAVRPNEPWTLQITRGADGAAFVGPYVVDRTHPLSAGMSLDGIVWGAPRGPLEGNAVVTVGAQNLLTAQETLVRMRFDPSISNLHRTPAWPALLYNLIEWRSSRLPGPRTVNAALGSNVEVHLAQPGEVTVIAPDNSQRKVDARTGVVIVQASMPGIWRAGPHSFAANPLVPGESDLTRATTGTWGGWSEEALSSAGYESAAWMALLAALAALAIHQRVAYGAAHA